MGSRQVAAKEEPPPAPAAPASSSAEAAEAPCSSEPFVNTGLLTWLERRRQWTKKSTEHKRTSRKRTYSPAVTPEQVLSFAPFPKPVPLEDVIEVLTEVWEQEDYFS